MNGILYFLTNKAMPGLVKIGYTSGDLKVRLQQLNTTGIPSPFQVSAFFYVESVKQCEAEVHKILKKYRSNPNREFFKQDISVLLRESIGTIGRFTDGASPNRDNFAEESFNPDDDDIYFMLYLLHESYERNTPLSAGWLSQHHQDYTPLEVELKLINLEEHGYVKRVSHEYEGIGFWQILPRGVKFMFDGNHCAKDLIEEARRN